MRGFVVPSRDFWFWTFVQAAGSLFAVGMMIRAYQVATASRVSVFEYVILPASAIWGWLLWAERLSPVAAAGMALIALRALPLRWAPARPPPRRRPPEGQGVTRSATARLGVVPGSPGIET
ncbi:hypothetical protein DWF04_006340 [Cereibacter sphaeroides f. sp. denitrificans]